MREEKRKKENKQTNLETHFPMRMCEKKRNRSEIKGNRKWLSGITIYLPITSLQSTFRIIFRIVHCNISRGDRRSAEANVEHYGDYVGMGTRCRTVRRTRTLTEVRNRVLNRSNLRTIRTT